MHTPDSAEAPNPIHLQDAEVLVGLLAVIEGYLLSDDLDDDLVNRLRERFVRSGLLAVDADELELRQAVNDLNQRMRYTAGEYAEPIGQVLVPPTRQPHT